MKDTSQDIDISVTFSGTYELFRFILVKYDLYKDDKVHNGRDGRIFKFLKLNNYSVKCQQWKTVGVPYKAWNSLYKDLLIMKYAHNIDFESLNNLKQEYLSTNSK